MNRKLFIFLIAFFAPMSLYADTLGFEIGAGRWSQDASGDFGTDEAPETTFTDGDDANIFWAAFEHPVPLLPNVRYAQAPVHSSNSSGDSLELDTKDLTLYYELLDNWFNLDVGVTGRSVEGTLESSIFEDRIDETIPMLYGKAEIELPVTGVSVGTEINTAGVYRDIAVFAAYETDFGLGVQAGKRTQSIDLDEDEAYSSLKNEGLYAAVYYHF